MFIYPTGHVYLIQDTGFGIWGALKYGGCKLFSQRPKEIRLNADYPISADDEARDVMKILQQVIHPKGEVKYGITKEDRANALIGVYGSGIGKEFKPQRLQWEKEHGWRK